MDHYAIEAYFDTLSTAGQNPETEAELKIKVLEFRVGDFKFPKQITAAIFDDLDEGTRYAYFKSGRGGVFFDQIYERGRTRKKISTLEEWSRGSEWIREALGY